MSTKNTSKTQAPAAFILGKRPETVAGTVEFPLPDGTTAKIPTLFKYRTRKEFGALWDQMLVDAGDKVKAVDNEKHTFAGMFERGDSANAENALKYIAGWPDTMPTLDKGALADLFDQAAAAPAAFWDAYRQLCTTGRLGNSQPQ